MEMVLIFIDSSAFDFIRCMWLQEVDSAFHPSEVDEMSIINAAQVCRVVRIVRDPPGELLGQEFECTQPGLVCAAE